MTHLSVQRSSECRPFVDADIHCTCSPGIIYASDCYADYSSGHVPATVVVRAAVATADRTAILQACLSRVRTPNDVVEVF